MPCGRQNDAVACKKVSYDKRLWQPHEKVTAVLLSGRGGFAVCCTCVEYPTRNIAAWLALTKQPTAGSADVGDLNTWRGAKWPVQLLCRFSMENPASLDISPRSANSRCWNRRRNTCSPSVGANMRIAKPRTRSSPAI